MSDLFGDNDGDSIFAVSAKKPTGPIVVHSGIVKMGKFSNITNDYIPQNCPIQLQTIDDVTHIKIGHQPDPKNDIIGNYDIDWMVDESNNAFVTQPDGKKWMISFEDYYLLVKYTYYAVKEKISKTEICRLSSKSNKVTNKISIIKYNPVLDQAQKSIDPIPQSGNIPHALRALNGALAFVKLEENSFAIIAPFVEESIPEQKNEPQISIEKPKKSEQSVKESMSEKLNQIESLKKEFQNQFDNLISDLNSLQIEKVNFDNVSMSGEDILDGVSSLVEESESIEKKLQKITDDIDRIKYESQCQDAAIEARQRVSTLTLSLERKTAEFADLKNKFDDLEKKTEIIKNQLNGLKTDSEKAAKEIEEKFKTEIASNNKILEDEVKDLEKNLTADKERLAMSESILSAMEEPTKDVDVTDLIYDDMGTIFAKIMNVFENKEKITGSEIISAIQKAYSDSPI